MLLKDLYGLLVKLKQPIPNWFEQMYANNHNNNYTQKYNKYKSNSNSNHNNNKYNKLESGDSSNNNYNSHGHKSYSNNNNNNFNNSKQTSETEDLPIPRFFNRNKDPNSVINTEPNGQLQNVQLVREFKELSIEKPKVINNGNIVSDYKSNLNKFSKIPEVTNEKFPRANYRNSNEGNTK